MAAMEPLSNDPLFVQLCFAFGYQRSAIAFDFRWFTVLGGCRRGFSGHSGGSGGSWFRGLAPISWLNEQHFLAGTKRAIPVKHGG